MAQYKPYPIYKNSGIPWLGEVPAHWGIQKAKWIFNKEKREVRAEDDVVTAFRDGQVTLRKKRRTDGFTIAIQEHGYQGIRKGDLVIHGMDAFAGAIGVSDSDGKASPVYNACTLKNEGEIWYYCWIVRQMSKSGFIESLAKGIRERSTDFRFDVFSEQLLPVPPPSEQTTIARFLDYKLAKINRFIRKKKQLIKLLNEQKAAIINQAVTKGLDPHAPMKESGIEWLGEVPAHWEVRKLKYVAEIYPSNVDKHSKEGEKSVRLCNYTDVYKNDYISNDMNLMLATASDEQIERFTLLPNDVIITKDSETANDIAVPAVVKGNLDNVVCGYHLSVMRPTEKIVGEFLFRVLQSKVINIQFEVNANGVTRVGLGTYSQKNPIIPLPPIDEQSKIIEFILNETHAITTTIATIEKEIALVEEYKTALIAEAVTGKIDVREYKVPELENEEQMEEELEDDGSMEEEDAVEYQTEETE
jgi:type I restriction enzyme S subunit